MSNNEDDSEELNNNKYEFLNAPILIEDFRKNYLSSLNIFLNDEKFKEKTDSLPILKSSAITKYEKLISKEEAEILKKRKLKLKNKNLEPLMIENEFNNNKKKLMSNTTPNLNYRKKINQKKAIQVRYIIIDHELVEISLKAIEENNEINNKLTDPFNAYFHEQNPKVRKKALEQIINNIIPNKKKNNNNEDFKLLYSNDEDNENNIFNKDLEILEKKYKNYEISRKRKEEKLAPLIKQFRESCNNNNIITLDQKIDYFAYLYKNKLLNIPNKLKKPSIHKTSSKKYKKQTKLQKDKTNTSNIPFASKPSSNFNFSNLLENNIKYTNELKNNFRISDDLLTYNNTALETFQRDIETKIKSYQILKNNFESSQKFIDKLRLCLRCEEVSLFFLISKYSNKIDYLNISNNKLGKQSIEILNDILQKNNVKIIGLSIGGNKLGDKLFSDISEAISKNIFLQKLFVRNNELGKISSAILGTILKYDKKLKLLDVSGNIFGDENISYMLKGLICNSSLETLMMNNMELTNKSLRIFETTLGINTTLKKLFLERNKINYKGWRLLSEILNKNKYIEYISLVGNNFENQHINYIIEQQRQIKIRTISKTDYFLQITSSNEEEVNLYEYID